MTTPKFSIRLSAGNAAVLYACGMIFILLPAAAMLLLELTASMRFLCCGCIVLTLTMLVMATIARYDVEGSVIRVRTGLGRVYQVSCEEIAFISCNQTHSARHGTRFSITVATEQKHFTVGGRLNGFSVFAGYLLDKLDQGVIKASAVSEACRSELRRYQKEFQPKK